jgi:steroid delta-isomerase-like uncharacterized protein
MTTRNTGLIAVLIFCFALLTSAKVFAQSDMEAKNTALMKRFYDEAVNQDKMELFDEFFSKDFVEHEDLGNLPSNKEGVKKFFAMQRQAFPDLKFTVNEIAASGDKVWAYITISGTQKGPLMDMPASGKQVKIKGFDLVRFANGKAVEHWGLTDNMSMMQQLGAMPAPKAEK